MSNRVFIGATLIDGTEREPIRDAVVVVSDNKIVASGPRQAIAYDPSAEVVDLAGKTIVPGLIDMHVHLGMPCTKPADWEVVDETQSALVGAQRARLALLAGFTTVRDCGSFHGTNIKLRNYVNSGLIPGPRICACGRSVVMTGGHGHLFGAEVDSPDEVRKLCRQNIKAGADCFKVMASGNHGGPELTVEEMAVTVAVGHDAGIKVAAHAGSSEGVENAVVAGIDTIEHGYTISESVAERMGRQATIVVPTMATLCRVYEQSMLHEYWRPQAERLKVRIDGAKASFQRARAAGVEFGLGTDGSSEPQLAVGELIAEARALSELGFSNRDILRAATGVAALGLGWQDRLGTIEVGKLADLTVLDGNPLADLSAYEKVVMVVKDGVTVVANGVILE